jgi:hypothetical protein
LYALNIERVGTEVRTDDDFKYISEWFGWKAAKESPLTLRTDPEHKAGIYFLLRWDKPIATLPSGSILKLEAYFTDSKELRVFEFPISEIKDKHKKLNLGLTNPEWNTQDPRALAWHILLIQDDKILAEYSSFLWEMPEDSAKAQE